MSIDITNRPLFADHPTFDPKKAWVLLWSQKQGHLHIERLHDMFTSHIRAYREDRDLQYIPLLIGDREAIDAVAEVIRPTIAERYDAKHAGQDGFIPYDQLP